MAVGDPLQIVQPVDLVADGGEGLGDGGEDGLAVAVGSVGEPVDGLGSDQRDALSDVVTVGRLLVGRMNSVGGAVGSGMTGTSLPFAT
ncbi:hypothetical protein M2163_001004 [Streptomyces sp. SAI-135]|jgi:hypothetical protein|nr:hypothetical protein [Streptomyces sp. SAI-090]MDH6573370.1 hypothetical protein [Streptomyces sp. SAI-117]MDH6613896.1 hypothetical protein [Streptomyces sp. SAI-135]